MSSRIPDQMLHGVEKCWEIILGRSVCSVTRKILSLNFWVRYIGKVIIKQYFVLDIISTRENNLCVVKCWISVPMAFEIGDGRVTSPYNIQDNV